MLYQTTLGMKNPVIMKNLFTLLLILFSSLGFGQLNVSYVSQVNFPITMSDVWGYVAPDGTEYALAGRDDGVSIINLADPSNPVESDFVPGVNSGWRDIKTWGEHAYVINETGNGLAVIDLSTLPDSVSAYNWTPNIPNLGVLSSCHNIFIDSMGFAYLSGCNLNNGGLLFIDVHSEPGVPNYAGKAPPVYSHDVYVRDNIAYSSEIGVPRLAIYNVENKAVPQLLATQETPGNVTHNAWLSEDSQIVFTTDEVANAPVASYDISDLSDIKELDQFRPLETLGDGVVPHNVHVWEDWLIISYYTDGCILVDASRPDNLIEVGNFDTYLPPSTGFQGAWGAYPFLPSGLILISDISNGLYILEPNYVRACWLEGTVTDASNGSFIHDANVEFVGALPSDRTDLSGNYATGIATSGTYEVQVSKYGFEPATATVSLENDVVTIHNFELIPLPSFGFQANIIEAGTGDPIPDAIVKIFTDGYEETFTGDSDGQLIINPFFSDNYEITVGKWGYKTAIISDQFINEITSSFTIELERGIEDIFSLDLGWEVVGGAPQGLFELGTPLEVPAPIPGILIQPGNDVPEDIGTGCYVTGNTLDLEGGVLFGGGTRITSPIFDISNMNQPKLSYYTWFLNVLPEGNIPVPGNDAITVKLTNGIETVTLEKVIDLSLFDPQGWQFSEFNILDTIAATENMQIMFEINDTDEDDISEGLVDYFQVWDADPVGTKVLDNEAFELSVYPNPSSNHFQIRYELLETGKNNKLVIFNLLGQKIYSQTLERESDALKVGSSFTKGIYFVQIIQDDKMSAPLKLIKH